MKIKDQWIYINSSICKISYLRTLENMCVVNQSNSLFIYIHCIYYIFNYKKKLWPLLQYCISVILKFCTKMHVWVCSSGCFSFTGISVYWTHLLCLFVYTKSTWLILHTYSFVDRGLFCAMEIWGNYEKVKIKLPI